MIKQVTKRDGSLDVFDSNKIVMAIESAMRETENGIDHDLAMRIANNIGKELASNSTTKSVEDISDIVEQKLMSSNRKDAAKQYILYRAQRQRVRGIIPDSILSDDFISKYKHLPTPMSPLGEFIYYRTYSRWKEEEKRREYWWETVRRTVEYNCTLTPDVSREEAEHLYDNLFHTRQFLSGRTLWIGGTKLASEYGTSNYNCAFCTIDDFTKFKDLFYLLMIGSGVGFRVLRSDTNKLPAIRTNVQLVHKVYNPVPAYMRQDLTSLSFNDSIVQITIGDSKEGWTQSLDFFFKILTEHEYNKISTIIVNCDHVRPRGERLKRFGGTASGHEGLCTMFTKIMVVIHSLGNGHNHYKKLRPINCIDIANIIGENVVSGGVRRTSELGLIEASDTESIQAKNALYIKDDNGGWIENKALSHRRMSNNTILYTEKPTYEQLSSHMQQIRSSGEPGFFNMQAALKRRSDCQGMNPCFSGDMRLLTTDGYKTFEELAGKTFNMVSEHGLNSNGKVWCSGEKQTIKLRLSDKRIIECTPEHIFKTLDNKECKAKDLKGQALMPYLGFNGWYSDSKFIKYGFIQGDGNLSRLDSDIHRGIEVNVGYKDSEIMDLFEHDTFTHQDGDRKIYLQGHNKILNELGFSHETLPNRIFPTTYSQWTTDQKASFLQGCYSANGGITTGHRVSYKTTCKTLANQLVATLRDDFNIVAYITTNKATRVVFSNGEYVCKESYDVNISRFNSIQIFRMRIGFYHSYKLEALNRLLLEKSPTVIKIIPSTVKPVYDFTEPTEHWGVVEGFIAHNCGEILLRDRGLCNLTTVNVAAFVSNGKLDTDGLCKAQRMSVRAGLRMTCLPLELHKWHQVQHTDRLLGCSLTGFRDAIGMLKYTLEQEAELYNILHETAKNAAQEYAEELGISKPLLVTAIKPEGTQSLMAGVSQGLHYPHSKYYIRRVRVSAQDPLVKVCEVLGYPIFPEVGQDISTCITKVIEFPVSSKATNTKYDVTAIQQLENYKMAMLHYVDHNASITITVRPDEWNGITDWLLENWDTTVAITFLPLEDSFYDLMPYEAITEDEYNKRISTMKPFRPSLLSEFEREEIETETEQSDCAGGACPIK